MVKHFCIFFLSILPLATCAQWRIGLIGGWDYNYFTSNEYYLSDLSNQGKAGETFGLMTQYGIQKWDWCDSSLGVRAEINITKKNHTQYREFNESIYLQYRTFETKNVYLQFPLMANYSFGCKKLKAFVNFGGYIGYWLCSKVNIYDTEAKMYNIHNDYIKIDFNNERDERLDLGLVGGFGVEWQLCRHIALQAEARDYYGLLPSNKKSYMSIKAPTYNNTLAIQAAICYIF